MIKSKGILWITRTALLMALLIVMQAVTAPLAQPLVTGSIVNLILIISVMTCGLSSGLAVAVVSPVMAKLFGIGPFWTIVPFIMLGNAVLVAVWYIIGNKSIINKTVSQVIALAVAAVCKFGVLYTGVVQVAIPLFLNLPEKQASVISATFSFQQFITASIGGAIAVLILPVLKKALKQE